MMRALFISSGLAILAAAMAVPAQADDSQFSHAEQLYNTYCVQCHGIERNGKGINSVNMSVQPRDHSDPKGMGDLPDSEIYQAIKGGGVSVNKSVLMPVWGNVLTDDEIKQMVAYLRHVCNCGPKQ